MTKEEAKKEIERLVARFREHREEYHLADYNETKTRRDFVDPFFKALGWDVDNTQGAAEAYREVIHEDKTKVQGRMKSPDYGFRLQGSGDKRLFYVEAKKPSVPLKVNKESSFQIRRYGLSSQTPVSILTNFEEFVVYDCSRKPDFNDSASVARLKYINFEQYADEFDFIYDTFSHEAVTKGRFDKFVKSDTYKKGSQVLDKYFVETLNEWRRRIAISIARNNLELNEDDINFVVQLTIDRLIFLRFCEDRGVEPYGQMQKAIASGNSFENLFVLFKQADDKYNSGLFDLEKDQISHNLKIDNKILKTISEEMYYPKSSYVFHKLPLEILGNAYEQFLGKVIRITKAHHAVIEDKPEVRKAGGVYYTPQYIVSYIVQNTVGKLIEGKSPKQIEKIKIVDPACGSGSFLIGAFQFLLDYHVKWYTASPPSKGGKKDSPLTPMGTLTSAEKKKILLNNIYGVDIDTNAVEVTKLSLLLKCMEGETEASIKQQLSLMHERVLPDLDNNIKSGNSLIDTDFYDSEFELGFEKKIKPFNWQKGFPEVFKQGGFDAVIGNPPWGATIHETTRKYIINKFPLVPTKTKDTYFYFLFQAIELSLKGSYIGLVLPNTWLLINNANNIRKYLLKKELIEIIDYGDSVFTDAIVEASSIILRNSNDTSGTSSVKRYRKGNLLISNLIKKEYWIDDQLNRFNINFEEQFDAILKKANSVSEPFAKNSEIIFGIKPYQLGYGIPPQTDQIISNRIYHSKVKKDSTWKPLLIGKDVNRYSIKFPDDQFIKYGDWLMYKSNEKKILGEKILLRRTSDKIQASLDEKQYYPQNSIFIITSESNLKYLLGLLNSAFMGYIYRKKCPQIGKIFAEVKPSIIKELPIKIIANTNKKSHDEIVKHVDLLLKLNEELKEAKLPEKTEQLKSRIGYSEDKINKLVYELYGLTEEEIKIVEGQ